MNNLSNLLDVGDSSAAILILLPYAIRMLRDGVVELPIHLLFYSCCLTEKPRARNLGPHGSKVTLSPLAISETNNILIIHTCFDFE